MVEERVPEVREVAILSWTWVLVMVVLVVVVVVGRPLGRVGKDRWEHVEDSRSSDGDLTNVQESRL